MYLVFRTPEEMNEFFEKNLKVREKMKIEYAILSNFKKNRVVFCAPHAVTERIYVGNGKYIGIGDKNTEKLAKIAALRIGSVYISPKFSRREADLTRDPRKLGNGIKLLAPLYGKKVSKTYVSIHTNKKFMKSLEFYHGLIGRLNPKALVFIHGMHRRSKADVVLGLGKNMEYFIGEDFAKKFLEDFKLGTSEALKKFSISRELKIRIARTYRGIDDYGLKTHVLNHNLESKKKRVGMNVEFNLRGRVTKKYKELPSVEYQLTVQVLADTLLKWIRLIPNLQKVQHRT